MNVSSKLGRSILGLALAVLVIDVSTTLMVSRARDKPAYCPSISEAGRFSAYPIYSTLGVLSSVLMCIGFEFYAFFPPLEDAPFVARGLVAIVAVVMSAAFCYQSVVRIDLTREECPHRTAAGIFFICSYVVTFAAAYLDQPAFWKSILRRVMACGIVLIMMYQERVYGQWSASASVAPLTLKQNNAYITQFSLMQYCLASALVVLMVSLLC